MMNKIDYIRTREKLIQEIQIKEVKYTGSTVEEIPASILVFPRVIIYESACSDDATYIFLVKERMECVLAFIIAEYFSSDAIRKRADFEKNLREYNFLFKHIIAKDITENEWVETINFYTNKRIIEVLEKEESYYLTSAIRNFLNTPLTDELKNLMHSCLPFVTIQKRGDKWNELCFPAFDNDKRYIEVESAHSPIRVWYNFKIQENGYSHFIKQSCLIKLCSYNNRYSQSDIMFISKMISKRKDEYMSPC